MTRRFDVALVTGASSGIGLELARQLARDGTQVALLARRRELIERLADEIRAAGGNALPLVADVRERGSIGAAVSEAARQLGPIDLLIANAGIGRAMPAASFDAAIFEDTIRTNLMGVVYAVEAVLPSMLERRSGQIAGVSSLAAYKSFPQTHAYCASKAALNSFLEGLRAEIASRGIHVTTICPGFIRTPMTAKNFHSMPFLMEPDDAARRILRAIRTRRRVCNFPWPLTVITRLVNLLPNALVDRAVRSAQSFE